MAQLISAQVEHVADLRPVKLTFHFWSGDKVISTVVRDGATVTGTAG